MNLKIVISRVLRRSKKCYTWKVYVDDFLIPEGFGEAHTKGWAEFRARCFANLYKMKVKTVILKDIR